MISRSFRHLTLSLSAFLLPLTSAYANCAPGQIGGEFYITTSVSRVNAPFSNLEIREEDKFTCLFGVPFPTFEAFYTISNTTDCSTIATGVMTLPIFQAHIPGCGGSGTNFSVIGYQFESDPDQTLITRGECLFSGTTHYFGPDFLSNPQYLVGGAHISDPICESIRE